MKVLFMGTPAFAAASLTRLLTSPHEVVGVVARPDARAGRGREMRACAVKEVAVAGALPLLQPARLKDAALREQLASLGADLIVVVAYGRILPQALLDLAARGAVNVHASQLPRYRGAAPVAHAILGGETRTGVTTMRMTASLDAGDILMQRATPIADDDTAATLEARLAALGAELLIDTLDGLESDTIQPVPQDHDRATWARTLTKDDGRLDWSLAARDLWLRVRAFDPWPVAWTRTPTGKQVRIWRAHPAAAASAAAAAGTILGLGGERHDEVEVAAGRGSLLLAQVQPEGGRRMPAIEAVSGRHLRPGDVLG
jgi:methionyl-tRNA formyltransferase